MATVGLSVVAGAAFIGSHAVPRANTTPTTMWPACVTEDSTNCYWNADVQGNGIGQSYVTIGDTVHYLDVTSRPLYDRLPSTL
jgi:hypothetical protein